jgi:2-keto-4-pentenoate hydratase/2-oxohepta-3-ene-1,7-dioic acid hydratase in catechol pathway
MRLATYRYNEQQLPAILDGDYAIIPALDPEHASLQSMLQLIDAGPDMISRLADWLPGAPDACKIANDPRRLCAPIPVPRQNVICLGWNYAEHAIESSQARQRDIKLPEHPIVFTKAVSSVNDPYHEILVDPGVTQELDWEVELAIVIGHKTRKVSREEALDAVFGYTVVNDLSARDLQFRHKQYFIGKSLDGACPMGPVIVTSDEIPDPQDLRLRSWVNGELKQDSSTRFQIFDCADIIYRLSQSMTLYPGDIIATGTPEGVGFARQPPEFLLDGDLVECEVSGIGRLQTRIKSSRGG